MTATLLKFPAMTRKSTAAPVLPNRIRELRKARDMTLQELGAETGIHFTNLQKLETGGYELKGFQMERIAAALRVTPADLLLPEQGGLTAEERLLIDTYRDLPAALRRGYDVLRDSHQAFRGGSEVVPLDQDDAGDKKKSA